MANEPNLAWIASPISGASRTTEIGSPRELKHPVCARLGAATESWMDIVTGPWMDFKVILFSIVTCVYTLIITLPRIRRELSLGEIITCSLIVMVSLPVIGFNLVKDMYSYLAHGFAIAEILATAEVAWFWVTLLRLQRRRQSR